MAVERQNWQPVASFEDVNRRLMRTVPVLDASARYAVVVANSTKTLALTYPMSLVESDTTAGAVTLTLPSAAEHPGFRVDVVKVAGGNTLSANSVTVTDFAAWVSTGAAWRRVA